MSGTGAIVAVVGALVVLVVYFSIVPLLGDRIDNAADISEDAYATGTLTVTDNVTDTETVTIGSVTYEFNTTGSVTAGNVDVAAGGTAASADVEELSSEISLNATTNASITPSFEVDGSTTVLTLTYNTMTEAANSVATTETVTNASFSNPTLTGGSSASEWASDDITTGADLWEDNGSMIAVAMVIVVVSVILLVLRGAF